MLYSINEIFQRIINYLYDEWGIIATLEDMYHDMKPRYNYDINEWYITRKAILEWLDDQGFEVTEETLDCFIFG